MVERRFHALVMSLECILYYRYSYGSSLLLGAYTVIVWFYRQYTPVFEEYSTRRDNSSVDHRTHRESS